MPILKNIAGYLVVAAALIPALIVAGVPLSAGAADQTDVEVFIAGSTDLPLMAGLTEVESARMVFDKSSGRIIETQLRGHVAAADARAFYISALGQLGWEILDQRAGRIVFVREQERLVMDFDDDEATNGGVEIRVLLGPVNGT